MKQAEWKRRVVDSGYNADWKCSNCGYKVYSDFPPAECPNCKSDMRGNNNAET